MALPKVLLERPESSCVLKSEARSEIWISSFALVARKRAETRNDSPIMSISHIGRIVASADGGARGLYVIDNQGRLGQAAADGETIETDVRQGGRKPLASWAGFEDFGYPVSFVVQKGKQDSVDLRVNVSQPGDIGARLTVRPVQPSTSLGLGGIQVDEEMGGSVRVLLPKDADGGAYEIRFSEPSTATVMANGRFPLVVYAPEYFRPFPKIQNPFAPIYFQVPEGENDGRIFFEGSAKLFDPDGEPYLDGAELQGWVKLPADKPGLWSFQPVKNWLVRVRNLPPFFAFDDPSSYFDSAIPWRRVDEQVFYEPPEEADCVPGVSKTETDRARNLSGGRTLTLESSPPRPSGDGGRFLPFKQGTIEFYIRPYWSTFDLWPRGQKVLVRMPADGQDWILQYAVYPEKERWPPMRSLYSHVLRGSFITTEPGRNNRFYGCRRLGRLDPRGMGVGPTGDHWGPS